MSHKIAVLVRAEVATRVVVEVADDFDVENISMEEFDKIANVAKPYLLGNINHDFLDCVTDIELDRECPHTDYVKCLKDFVNTNGIVIEDNTDGGKPLKVYLIEKPYQFSINSNEDELHSIFLKDGKLHVGFDSCGFIMSTPLDYNIDEDVAESLYLYLKETNKL